MVNAELVRRGLARVFLKFPNLRLEGACEGPTGGHQERTGAVAGTAGGPEDHYVGNIRSYRFHRPNCPGAESIAQVNRRIIKSPLEAYWEGYSPAKDCHP